jgi:hypothetical protein
MVLIISSLVGGRPGEDDLILYFPLVKSLGFGYTKSAKSPDPFPLFPWQEAQYCVYKASPDLLFFVDVNASRTRKALPNNSRKAAEKFDIFFT